MANHAIDVHHNGAKSISFLKWEGYITADGDFQVHYFDNAMDYTQFVCKVYHTGNVTFVSREEYDKAYYHYMQLTCW